MIGAAPLGSILDADLWRFPLDVGANDLESFWLLLSPAERARADRFRTGPRERYVAARGQLRRILSSYLEVSPAALAFGSGPHGKPVLEHGPRFNLSHSAALGICAVSPGREVGVDLEALRPVPEAEAIAERWMGRDARAALEADGQDRAVTFMRLWTRREAYLKALGIGLARAERPAEPVETCRWVVLDLDPAPGFVGALALERLPASEGARQRR